MWKRGALSSSQRSQYVLSISFSQQIGVQEPNNDIIAQLEQFYQHPELEELHTHLLGMGSKEFWVDFLMMQALPLRLLQYENKNALLTKTEDKIETETEKKIDFSLLQGWYGPLTSIYGKNSCASMY